MDRFAASAQVPGGKKQQPAPNEAEDKTQVDLCQSENVVKLPVEVEDNTERGTGETLLVSAAGEVPNKGPTTPSPVVESGQKKVCFDSDCKSDKHCEKSYKKIKIQYAYVGHGQPKYQCSQPMRNVFCYLGGRVSVIRHVLNSCVIHKNYSQCKP